ncbi:hypothetical protein STEG23_019458 [Scotinomys teguina]
MPAQLSTRSVSLNTIANIPSQLKTSGAISQLVNNTLLSRSLLHAQSLVPPLFDSGPFVRHPRLMHNYDSHSQTPVDLPRLENAFFSGPLSRQVTTEIHRVVMRAGPTSEDCCESYVNIPSTQKPTRHMLEFNGRNQYGLITVSPFSPPATVLYSGSIFFNPFLLAAQLRKEECTVTTQPRRGPKLQNGNEKATYIPILSQSFYLLRRLHITFNSS